MNKITKNIKTFLTLILFLLIIGLLSYWYLFVNKGPVDKSVSSPSVLSEIDSINFHFNPIILENIRAIEKYQEHLKMHKFLDNQVSEFEGNHSVYFKDLRDGEVIQINTYKSYTPASTFKIYTALLILNDIENDLYSLDKRLVLEYEKENGNGETEIIKTSAPVSELLKNMIIQSDNDAHIALLNALGRKGDREGIDKRIYNEVGVMDTSLVEYKTTSKDLGLALEGLYEGEIINNKSSEYLIDLMQKSRVNNRIKAGVPEGIRVANKYGSLGKSHHDSAIIYANNTDYILVILSDKVSLNDATEAQKEMSKMVWEYVEDKEYYEEIDYLN